MQQSRKPKSGMWVDKDGSAVFVGSEYHLTNEIEETKAKTRSRTCFKECRTCGACSNSRRDATYPKNYDANQDKWVDCRSCEKFRFHDCHNGWFRDAHQDAEEFTDEVKKMLKETGGRPLI